MAGCGQCPDTCSCVIVDENGIQYDGAGVPLDPIVIPRAKNTPWLGTSDDGSITITPGDVVDSDDDGHAPDFSVNFCELIEEPELEAGDILVVGEDANCRPHRLRDPIFGEFLGLDGGSGKAGWVQGAVISGGEVPFGVPLEFWGTEASVPGNYVLCYGQLIPIASAPQLFAVIQHNANGGVDPGGGMFRIPDKRGYVTAGRDNMGGVSANRMTNANMDILGGTTGAESAVIGVNNIPGHTHPLSINGSGTGLTVNNGTTAVSVNGAATGVTVVFGGTHNHDGAGANHDFVVENSAPESYVYLDITAINVDTAGTMRFTSNGVEGGLSRKPNREPLASGTLSGHTHGISDPTHTHSTNNPAHGHTVNDPGHSHTGTATANTTTNTALTIVQPTQAVNYIMRTV